MSDHEAVIFSINCERPSINIKAPCRVYLYHKGDIPSLKEEIQEFQEYFCASDLSQNSVEDNWQLLKHAIEKTISKHIYEKLPWISPAIKRKMKPRKLLYDKAKQTGSYTDWCEYKQGKNEINSLLETAHQNYCSMQFI